MCGICGVSNFSRENSPYLYFSSIQPMLKKLKHRGPQETSTGVSGSAAFGAQRLAIRGLDDGTQPIIDQHSGVIMACNGEIDNHKELREWLARRGHTVTQKTDIAVLPSLYLEEGEKFVERLEGVFAIALWDPRQEKLILARDRAGERPLFYKKDGGNVCFATEVSALAVHLSGSLSIDQEAIAGYLDRGCFIAPASPFCGVEKVRPGEIISITNEGVNRRLYWRWPVGSAKRTKPFIKDFDEIFCSAVKKQSDIDVDFGVFLSGGVDSSLLAGVLHHLHPNRKIPCYTLRFAEGSYDEGAPAARVAEKFGFDMVSVPVTPEMFVHELPHLVGTVGEPLADPAWIPTALLARRAAKDVRMVFSGEGGDELFGGYPTYLAAGFAQGFDRLPFFIRKGISSTVNSLPSSERKMPLSFLLKRFVAGEGMDPFDRHKFWTANISPDILERLGIQTHQSPLENNIDGSNLLDTLQLFDLETSLAEGLLTKSDRGGMSESLEIRAPFLDHSVMEYAAQLPAKERVRGITTKHFLKRYASLYLPDDIVYRRKRGLSIPLASWLRGPLASWATNKLQSNRLAGVGLRPEVARELLREHIEKKNNHARTLWSLLVLEEWLAWEEKV